MKYYLMIFAVVFVVMERENKNSGHGSQGD
jgi:hypothetical protein